MFNLQKLYEETVAKAMADKYQYKCIMEVPKLVKVVVNRGLGESLTNSKVLEITVEQFQAITGQKPVLTKAKKSISNFKLREGQPVGCMVTLRGRRMFDFLTKLIYAALPKIRDFRGVSAGSFDSHGNYSMGLKEMVIFPEVKEEDRARGLDITIVTTAKTKAEAYDLLKGLGMPFRAVSQT